MSLLKLDKEVLEDVSVVSILSTPHSAMFLNCKRTASVQGLNVALDRTVTGSNSNMDVFRPHHGSPEYLSRDVKQQPSHTGKGWVHI